VIYTQVKPCVDLEKYIDAFWLVKGIGQQLKTEHIYPDGCIDLIFNLNNACITDNNSFVMQSRKSYLVGTMTLCKESYLNSKNTLIGVRFKPSAFPLFYNFGPLNEFTDITIEFDPSLSPDIHKTEQYFASYLNAYFLNRLTKPKNNLSSVIEDIQAFNGQISIDTLAKRNYTTIRQLERNFKKYIGITPKEFTSIVRFQFALSKIRDNKQQKNLLDVAFECGYYDQAHLSNEIKRYTRIPPSQF